MTHCTRGLRLWYSLLAGLSILFGMASFVHLNLDKLKAAALVLMGLVLAKVIPIELSNGTELSLSGALDITCALMLGPAGPVVGLAAGMLAALITHLEDTKPTGFSTFITLETCHDVLAVAAAGYIVQRFGFKGLGSLESAGIAVMGGSVYMFSRSMIRSISFGLRYNVPAFMALSIVTPSELLWQVVQVATGVFGVYTLQLVPLSITSLIGFGVFASIVIYAARLYIDMRSTLWSTILALIPAIESEFEHNVGHARRVSAYAFAIARKMLLPERIAAAVYIGGILHDVGMVGVDDQIVNKPAVLSPEEHALVERHVDIGAGIVEKVPLLRSSLDAIKHHHERWDGNGYPQGLKGEQIPVSARIVAVADAFDALLSKRPHRQALQLGEALEEMRRGAGRQFDPRIVALLELAVEDELRWGKDVFDQHYSMDLAR